jgi:hypothetical protein
MNWTYVQYAALIAVAVLLFWLPTRIEVHWAARDGTRCICRGQLRDDTGMAQSPWREYRVQVAPNGDVVAYRRSLFGGRRGGSWRVVERADDVPHRKAEFLLRPQHEMTPARTLAVRLPAGSRAVAVLDHLAQGAEMDR